MKIKGKGKRKGEEKRKGGGSRRHWEPASTSPC